MHLALLAGCRATAGAAWWMPTRCLNTCALPPRTCWSWGAQPSTGHKDTAKSVCRVDAGTTPLRITPQLQQRLQEVLDRHNAVAELLANNQASQLAPKHLQQLNKEYGQTQAVSALYNNVLDLQQQVQDLQALASDADQEIRSLAREEHATLQAELHLQEGQLVTMLLPKDEDDQRSVVLEVRAGAGGDEAALFAADLLLMYQQFATLNGWQAELLECTKTDGGGYKYVSMAIQGEGVFGSLKFESGVHRVQRVPTTDAHGRIHTSTATVAVLPEATEVDVAIKPDELRIDTYRAGGAGGQHVNTTDSAVRITHLPSGTVVACQDERSQHKNKAKALQILRARLYEAAKLKQLDAIALERKQAVGSGDRNERIRTYNFPQGRVTDHRVNVTEHGIEQVMQGERLDTFIKAMQKQHTAELLSAMEVPGARKA